MLVRPGFEPATSRARQIGALPLILEILFFRLDFITDHWRLPTDKKPEGSQLGQWQVPVMSISSKRKNEWYLVIPEIRPNLGFQLTLHFS